MEATDLTGIERAIESALDEALSSPAGQGPAERGPETVLVGEEAGLDSMTFVMFALTLEKEIDRRFGVTLSVMDLVVAGERLTIGGLAQRIAQRLEGRSG